MVASPGYVSEEFYKEIFATSALRPEQRSHIKVVRASFLASSAQDGHFD